MTAPSLFFVEILERELGGSLQSLIATTIRKDQIDAIRSHSELSYSSWLKTIEELVDTEKDLEYKAKFFIGYWKDLKNKYEEYKVSVGRNPVLAFSILVSHVLQYIEICRIDMKKRYNVDPEKEFTVKYRNFSDRIGTIIGFIVTIYDLHKCTYWMGLSSMYSYAIQFKETKSWDNDEFFCKATMDMINILELIPFYINMGIRSQYESAKHIAFGSLSGWASTEINPRFFKRGLGETGTNESISDSFLKKVMSAAYIAGHEIEWNQNFRAIQTELKRHISKSIGMDGPKRPSESTRPATEPWQQRLIGHDPTFRALEEWQAHERAVRENFDALRRAGDLGLREALVFELLRQEWTEQEIAEELGIEVGTVKSTKSHIRKKIRDGSGDSEVAIDRSDDHFYTTGSNSLQEKNSMFGPGQDVPDPTEGIIDVQNLPAPQIVAYERNHEHTPCLRCGHICYRHKWGERTLHDLGDLSTGHPVDLLVTYSSHYCSSCRKHFNIDLSDVAPPGSHYTHRVIELAVRLVVEDNLPYRPASWHLWRDHRVFVPFATIQNWVEARGKKGARADGRGLSGMVA
jgi:DNA-binding CsgD family transcriptional regulator